MSARGYKKLELHELAGKFLTPIFYLYFLGATLNVVSERYIVDTPIVAAVVGTVLFFMLVVTPVRICYGRKAKICECLNTCCGETKPSSSQIVP